MLETIQALTNLMIPFLGRTHTVAVLTCGLVSFKLRI